jgi:hypothetical protein
MKEYISVEIEIIMISDAVGTDIIGSSGKGPTEDGEYDS